MNQLSHSTLLKLKRWNTPTIYNGWEAITAHNRTRGSFNEDATTDYMPEMGPMVGYAVTVVIEPSNREHQQSDRDAWTEYRAYVASIEGPKIVVVQDLDKPRVVGAFWGEVNSNIHRALGCVGTITDGAIRDVDEMKNAGFKAIARRLCVGHAFSTPVRWGCDVEVFGCSVQPGALVHADKHGFLVIPAEDHERLLDAATFADAAECDTVIAAARSATGERVDEVLESFRDAGSKYSAAMREKFRSKGEW